MIKAYKFGLIVNDSDFTEDTDSDRKETSDETFDELLDYDLIGNEWHPVDWTDEGNPEIEGDENRSIHLSCFAHSLQLTIRDGLKNSPYLPKVLAKCMKISRRANTSSKIVELLEGVGRKLKRSNQTRWSSEYALVKSIVDMGRKTLDEITGNIGDDAPTPHQQRFPCSERSSGNLGAIRRNNVTHSI
jgi:hypothetical protein